MKNRKSGFTLLELLTVIAILGLLMGILLPSLSAARDSAKANACLSHVKMIANGFSLYLNENDDKFPPFRIETTVPGSRNVYVNEYKRAMPRWQWFLRMDMGPLIDPKPFASAITRVGYFHDETQGRAPSLMMSHDAFTCPTLSDPDVALSVRDGAFGYNFQYLGNARQDKIAGRWDNFPVASHRIKSTSGTVLIADSRGTGPRHGTHSYTLDPPRLGTEANARRFGPEPSTSDLIPDTQDWPGDVNADLFRYSPAEARHKNRANVAFVDSHAEAMTLREMGYQFLDETSGVADSDKVGAPRPTPAPIHDPTVGPYMATNKLWNGLGFDSIAQEQNAGP